MSLQKVFSDVHESDLNARVALSAEGFKVRNTQKREHKTVS